VTSQTVFDIASLTKPLVAAVAMRLAAKKLIDLDAKPANLLGWPSTLRSITLTQLLGHAAGFPAHRRFYERLWAGEREGAATRRAALIAMAAATELESSPGQVARYSDVGYILLGAALEKLGNARLDQLLTTEVTCPLGMKATRYVDLDADPVFRFAPGAVAATEVCPVRGLVLGEVHDENAHAAGGICGHAGVFSTVSDLSRFAAALCAAKNQSGQHFDPRVVDHFFRTSAAANTSWRLGWDTPSHKPGESHAGDRWPRDSVGHLGFTGCSLWLHPSSSSWVILLTNRVHPRRDGDGIRDLRRRVMDQVTEALRLI
jgi:CubicO group peptidase (beta-lactamase class C family)